MTTVSLPSGVADKFRATKSVKDGGTVSLAASAMKKFAKKAKTDKED